MHAREGGHRSTHPSQMLTSLLCQSGQMPFDSASDEVKAVFAEHTVITNDNKNALLLLCARSGMVPLLRAVLQAGANVAHTDEVRVRTWFEWGGMRVSGVHDLGVCVCVGFVRMLYIYICAVGLVPPCVRYA